MSMPWPIKCCRPLPRTHRDRATVSQGDGVRARRTLTYRMRVDKARHDHRAPGIVLLSEPRRNEQANVSTKRRVQPGM